MKSPSSTLIHKTALILAGGTGGHIFPALAVARALQERHWQVHWIGTPGSMEERIIVSTNIRLHLVQFKGVRGKGLQPLLALPWRLTRAVWQSLQILRRVRPQVVLGFGGYVSFPAGVMTRLLGLVLILHEQNSVAGAANRYLAKMAKHVFTAFPDVLKQGQWVGNPLRPSFLQQARPQERYAARTGPLQLLVLGGSLGAQVFNQVVPQALAMLSVEQRPVVVHQGGAQHQEALQMAYQSAQVQASLHSFIDDTAAAMAAADVVISRAGASTVCELAAVGVASYLVPFPYATDDHQTSNARFLAAAGAALCVPQTQFTAAALAQWLRQLTRANLCTAAVKAHALAKKQATAFMVAACEESL